MEQNNKIILFQEKRIRREWLNEQWFFSVVDVIGVLTDSPKPSNYWTMLKKRENQLSTICVKVKLEGLDGKKYPSDMADTEGLFRIIMSIPSPKAEPFKLWLAKVGRERLEEIENPEIGFERLKEIYRAKGYPDDWIETRLKSIDIRKQLTNEWKGRGVKEGQEYAILTAEIARATFGLTPNAHKQIKGLDKQNLRDHMTNLELIFTMLGEETTRRIAVKDDALGFEENHDAAQRGGYATGEALKRYELTSGESVVSPENFLNQIKNTENDGALPSEEASDNPQE